MKKNIFPTLLLIGLAVTGCEKNSINQCGTCYAPINAGVSWTEYNSVMDLHTFFNHHDSTLMQYVGDTIHFCGWVYYPDEGENEPIYDIMIPDWSAEKGTMFLVDNEDHHFHGNYGSAFVTWPVWGPNMSREDSDWYDEHADFVRSFSDYLSKKWFITARIEYDTDLGMGCCSNFAPRYRLLEIDTIKR